MKIFRRAVGFTAVLSLGILGACSSGGGSDTDVTLTWWATQGASSVGESEDVYNEIIDAFTEETGIKVEVEVIPWGDLYNRILTAIPSGTGPDVLNIGTTWTSSLHDTGALAVIDDEALEWLGGSEKFAPAVWESSQIPGEDRTAMPLYSQVYSMYYNTSIFEANSIDAPPATWEEFLEVAQTLTQDTDGDGRTDQWGVAFPVGSATSSSHMGFILGQQHGGEFVDADGNIALDSPEMIKAVEAYVGLMGEDGVLSPSLAEVDLNSDAVDEVINANAAMTFQQAPIQQMKARDFEDWAVAAVPVLTGGNAVMSMVAGTNVTVFDESEHKQQAFEFVGFLTEAEQNAKMASGFSALPVVGAAWDQPEFSDPADQEMLEVRRTIQENHVAPFPLVPEIGEIEQAIGSALVAMFQDIATGQDVDVAERLKTVADQLR